jgi:hypothetical protein
MRRVAAGRCEAAQVDGAKVARKVDHILGVEANERRREEARGMRMPDDLSTAAFYVYIVHMRAACSIRPPRIADDPDRDLRP